MRLRVHCQTQLVDQICRVHLSFSHAKTIHLTFIPSAGPIIEQATHACDLSRYFGGEIDLSSITAHALEWYEKAGHLSKVPVDEEKIPPEDRIPRVTAATWCVLHVLFEA